MATNKNRGTSISRYNVIATYSSGKVGNARLYQHGSRSYVRAAYNSAATNPRTDNQMKRRLRWANMSHVYGYFKPQLLKSFEGTTPFLSTFNLFMKANSESGVFFTKGENDFRCAVIQPWQMSKGSLPEIESIFEATTQAPTTKYLSAKNIVLDSFTDISTIGKLSSLILSNNPIFREGDKITLVVGMQKNRNRGEGAPVPFIEPAYRSIILDTTDETINTDWSYSPVYEALSFVNPVVISPGSIIMGFTYIWTRNEGGKMLVSNSYMQVSDNADYESYLNKTAFDRAASSYGETNNVFLDPKTPVDVVTITASVQSGQESLGSVTGGGTYTKGSVVNLTATPVAPAVFVKWSDDTTDNPYEITANQDIALTAIFDSPQP